MDAPALQNVGLVLTAVGAIAVATAPLFSGHAKKNMSWFGGVLIAVATLLVALVQLAVSTFVGKLVPIETTLVTPESLEHVFLGQTRSRIGKTSYRGVDLVERSVLRVVRSAGVLKASTRVHDKAGRLVAELIDSEWKVNPNASYERNYSRDAVEVLDESGNVVLQVRVRGDRIELQAVYHLPSGSALCIWNGDDMSGVLEKVSPGRPLSCNIKRLFKYPAEMHLGEYL